MMDFENAREVILNANIGTVAEKVKGLPVYEMFKEAVKKGDSSDDTEKLLMITTMMFTLGDKETGLLMHKVASDLLYSALNTRLRSEILGAAIEN